MKAITKQKAKELMIVIPLVVIALFVTFTIMYEPSPITEHENEILIPGEQQIIQTNCQEGWFKYESIKGIICSETEMTEEQIQKEFDKYG